MRATQLVLRHAYAIDIAILAIDGIASTISGSCWHGPERRNWIQDSRGAIAASNVSRHTSMTKRRWTEACTSKFGNP